MIDNGPGIAPEHLPRLTERFYRVDVASSREKGGTGLGLAIVKHILNRHRGELVIASKPGKGSTFTVMLNGARAPGGQGRRGELSRQLSTVGRLAFQPASGTVIELSYK